VKRREELDCLYFKDKIDMKVAGEEERNGSERRKKWWGRGGGEGYVEFI
jgi:hypothetical protein